MATRPDADGAGNEPPRRAQANSVRLFCAVRFELLNSYVSRANAFAEAVRSTRNSHSHADGIDQAERDTRLAREAYEQHVLEHGC